MPAAAQADASTSPARLSPQRLSQSCCKMRCWYCNSTQHRSRECDAEDWPQSSSQHSSSRKGGGSWGSWTSVARGVGCLREEAQGAHETQSSHGPTDVDTSAVPQAQGAHETQSPSGPTNVRTSAAPPAPGAVETQSSCGPTVGINDNGNLDNLSSYATSPVPTAHPAHGALVKQSTCGPKCVRSSAAPQAHGSLETLSSGGPTDTGLHSSDGSIFIPPWPDIPRARETQSS